ncbi:MAG: hypothetical protein BGO41_09965 [Clostridiales bacterium 38-18]|nr:MAG: hypothetical protein BGO41_09965 [Clostridiales bacterium 38-18]
MKKRMVIISKEKNPYVNHAIEEILFTTFVDYEQILFLWVNEPSVVFGRNQNPWHEIDVRFAKEKGIHLLRRISGGGTVYHDLGNLNYSFIEHHSLYSESEHFELIIAALAELGIQAEVSPRKDLVVDSRKVSGSAFFMKGLRRLHHGTLLIDTDLETLWKSLKVRDEDFKNRFEMGRTIRSVPSPVVNLAEVEQQNKNQQNENQQNENQNNEKRLKVNDVIGAIIDTYYSKNAYQVEVVSVEDILKAHQPAVETLSKKLASWEWIFGETPTFTYTDEAGSKHSFSSGTVTPEGINSLF